MKDKQGMVEVEEGHILTNGVPVNKRAAAGSAYVMHKDLKNALQQCKGWPESILTVQLRPETLEI